MQPLSLCQEHTAKKTFLLSLLPYPKGFICPEGTVVPRQLKPGFYRRMPLEGPGLRADSTAAMLCPEGFYCTGGVMPPRPCLPGYVSAKGAGECFPCPAGGACKTSRAADIEVRHFLSWEFECIIELTCHASYAIAPTTLGVPTQRIQ